MSARRLPIFLDLSKHRVLIAGGGRVAERKLPALLDAGARITLIAPSIRPLIRELLRDPLPVAITLTKPSGAPSAIVRP